ncbi:MAG: peptidoglycan-binding protein [Bryobacteraceae bacterium]|nr:peptidoglycan-binding protein [Bryobacteraceae bacterium]
MERETELQGVVRLLVVRLAWLFLAAAVSAGFFVGGTLGAAPQSSAKKAPAKPAAKSASKTAAKSSKSKSKSKSAKNRSRRPAAQQAPDEARVREIQQALASRGYNIEVTGSWGPQSVEALKKFQEDQNITNLTGRGKLDPLTLIALGLGPNRPPAATGAPGAPEAEPARESKVP